MLHIHIGRVTCCMDILTGCVYRLTGLHAVCSVHICRVTYGYMLCTFWQWLHAVCIGLHVLYTLHAIVAYSVSILARLCTFCLPVGRGTC